ncbi:MAG: flagellar basal body-associated FliL family protein [Paracoccaceae bacterium]
MTDATADETEEPPKSSKLPLVLGLVAAIAGGGGGFFATYSGMLFAPEPQEDNKAEIPPIAPIPNVTFVEIEPMTISLGRGNSTRHLRFRANLEVPAEYQTDVEKLLPRVMDVLNGYLRALTLDDFERAEALPRLRAQMLRRIQIVTGKGRVNDFLIMEFVLS